MTVRHSLLAMLADQPAHGYALKTGFETSTSGTWPLNIGQVYTTLARLRRDGLVEPENLDDHGPRQTWRITDKGRLALEHWYESPVLDDPPARDELAIKVLLAVATQEVDVSRILQGQRAATMERLQSWTRLKRQADPEQEIPWLLLLDALILKAEAEIHWLDICEQRLSQGRHG
ncbi:MAG: PadR family transcriptional regulator [Planctomycetota bacterium]